MQRAVPLLFCVLSQAIAGPPHSPEGVPAVTPGWYAHPLADVAPEVTVVLAVKQKHLDQVEAAFWRVSNPGSPEYGQYWNIDRLSRVIDCDHSAQMISDWLLSAGPNVTVSRTVGGEFIRATLPHQVAEQLFGVELSPYCHPHQVCRLGSKQRYSFPAELQPHLEFVSGLRLPLVRRAVLSPHAHAKEVGAKAQDAVAGVPSVVNLEARDRAFQAHVNIAVDDTLLSTHCGNSGFSQPGSSLCDDGASVMDAYECRLTPTHYGEDYLRAVNLTSKVSSRVCELQNRTFSCVLVLGPDVALVNYVATKVAVRVRFQDGSYSVWSEAPMLGYPTKGMTVNDVRKLYSMPQAYTDPAPELNSQAVANFLGISINVNDSKRFQRLMGSRQQPEVRFRGPNNQSALLDVEGSIDVQWIQGMGRGVPTTYHSTTGGQAGHEPFLDWLVGLANESSPEWVQSLSYGENEDAYGASYQQRGDIELMKLGLRGVSVLCATGDTGIQGAAQAGGAPPQCAPFVPIWPASSPYVTAVGGTQFSTHSTPICNVAEVYSYGTSSGMPFACPDDDIGEIACSADTGAMITTGGGFSNRYPRPWYQSAQVDEYLAYGAEEIPPMEMFNASGRAYPDIAAISQNVPAVFDGELVMVGGTSAAAPIASGLVASLNGALLSIGKPTLGFLNPLLYALQQRAPESYIDVRVGNTSGGNRLGPTYSSCEHGFKALAGWDAATGLGSLNFDLIYGFVTNGSRPLRFYG